MSSGSDKRDSERLPILGALLGEMTVLATLRVREVSRGGVSVETTFPLAVDSLHDIRLTLGERSIVMKGRVVHSRISDVDQDLVMYTSGIEFVEPSGHVQQAVADFLETVKTDRSGV
jgi:hypothetical protein